MKISQMTTEKAASVLVKITEPVSNILADRETVQIIDGFGAEGEEITTERVIALLFKLVPHCLDKHKNDTFSIIAALADKTEDDVRKQNVLVTFADIRESIDKDLVDFFKSFTGSETVKEKD